MLVRPSVVILTDNKLLLLKYNYGGHDVYGLPGGNPDEDDTLEDTIVRELKEELNLDVEVLQLIIAGEVIFKEKSKSTLHCVFSGRVASGPPVINPEHTSALGYEWKDINELDTINMYPNIGKHIKAWVSGESSSPSGPYIGQIKQQWF